MFDGAAGIDQAPRGLNQLLPQRAAVRPQQCADFVDCGKECSARLADRATSKAPVELGHHGRIVPVPFVRNAQDRAMLPAGFGDRACNCNHALLLPGGFA